MHKFSVILPVRNGGEYVKACVESILAQSYPHFNLIVLNNNSDDGTTEWLRQLTDERIELHHSEVSLSMVANWGRIKAVKKNEFMTIIGHDDLLFPDYLAEMIALIEAHPDASVYQTHFNYIDDQSRLIRVCQPMDAVQSADEFLTCQIFQTLDSTGTGYMFRSADYERLGGIPTDFPNLIFADYALWMQLILLSYKATSPKICFEYRIHNSVSKLTNGELYCEAFEKYILFLTEMKLNHSSVRDTCDSHGHRFMMYFTQSLSHRLLKTAENQRKLSVLAFVKRCNELASSFIPNKSFHPLWKWSVMAAVLFDINGFSRKLFWRLKGLER
jgi:glycosyltransferase involved in cell wall biosynthesis